VQQQLLDQPVIARVGFHGQKSRIETTFARSRSGCIRFGHAPRRMQGHNPVLTVYGGQWLRAYVHG